LYLAWPVLAQQGLNFLVTQSDRYLAGVYQPEVAYQAAQTTANYLQWVIISYTLFVTIGSTALVARFVGAEDRQRAIHVTNQALVLAVVFGVAGSAAALTNLPRLVALLQLHDEAAEFAGAYLWPLFLLLTFQMVESVGIACLIGAGDTRTGLWVLGGVAVINLPLAWGFF